MTNFVMRPLAKRRRNQSATQRLNPECQRNPRPHTTGVPTITGRSTTTGGPTGATTTCPPNRHLPKRSRKLPGPQPPSTRITPDVAPGAESGAIGAAWVLAKAASEIDATKAAVKTFRLMGLISWLVKGATKSRRKMLHHAKRFNLQNVSAL
jgi:hypothetical protein